MPKADYRSAEAERYRALYKSAAWLKGRVVFLGQHPLCQRCAEHGRTTPASIVNHRVPHRGNPVVFFDWTNWQALCKPCHDGPAQSDERMGRLKGSINGRPRDPRHPWNLNPKP